MIACAGLVKRFPDRLALDGLSLDVGTGQLGVLLGHNGAGKTTLLRVLAGRLTPDAGTARIDGLDPERDRRALAMRVGVAVSPASAWTLRLGAVDNLVLFGVAQGLDRRAAHAAARREIDRAALTEHASRPVGTYSQGMRARLAVARALLTSPDLLLLDEPTAGLDGDATARLRALLAEARASGTTVLLATHDAAELAEITDVTFRLERGKVVTTAPAAAARAGADAVADGRVEPGA